MTPTQISTLLSLLAGAIGLALELLGVPGASVAGLVAGALGVRRPGDVSVEQLLRNPPRLVGPAARAGKPAPGSMDAEVAAILDAGVLD